MNIHVKAKVSGNPIKVKRFHSAMRMVDSDWPYAGPMYTDKYRQTPQQRMICKTCGGKAWGNPKFGAQDIKAFAKQMGVKVKIRHFGDQDKCKDNHGVLAYTATPEPTIAEIAASEAAKTPEVLPPIVKAVEETLAQTGRQCSSGRSLRLEDITTPCKSLALVH